MTQPAARIKMTPKTKMIRFFGLGIPSAANQSAQSVGQSSSSVPMGLLKRISRKKSGARSFIRLILKELIEDSEVPWLLSMKVQYEGAIVRLKLR